jgi:hypothetical protein
VLLFLKVAKMDKCKRDRDRDDDDDDEYFWVQTGAVDKSKIDKAYENIHEKATKPSGRERPVIKIDSLHDKYKRDPTGAIIDSIIPFESANDIRTWNSDNKIGRVAEWYAKAGAKADAFWENPVYRFIRMVESLVTSSRRANTRTNVNTAHVDNYPIQVIHTTAPALKVVNPDYIAPAVDEARAPRFSVAEPTPEAEKELRYAQDVNAVMDTMGVTGEFQLTDSTYTAIVNSIAYLSNLDAEKFSGHDLEDFLHDRDVMSDFATLVALHILLGNVRVFDRWFLDAAETRRKQDIIALGNKFVIRVVWDNRVGGFVQASPDVIKRNIRKHALAIRKARAGYF